MVHFRKIFCMTNFYLLVPFFTCKVMSNLVDKCDIAVSLANVFEDINLVSQWLCLAEKLSSRNSSALNKHPQSDDCNKYTLGIFQVSNAWCSTSDNINFGICKRNGCKLDCMKLLDEDLTDDIACIKYIHELDNFMSWPPILVSECLQETQTTLSTEWNSTKCLNSEKSTKARHRNLTNIPLWIALLIVALSSFIVFSITFIFYRYRRNQVSILTTSELKQFKYGNSTSSQPRPTSLGVFECIQDNFSNEPYNEDFEVRPLDFSIDYGNCLGSGAYGIVYKAVCKDKITAAKALKPEATKEYMQSLLGEIKILSHIGRHDCIVNLEGAYTKNLQKGVVVVFMEYCPLGSLEKFLRSNRHNYFNLEEIQKRDSRLDSENTSANLTETCMHILNYKNLLQYAYQIAKGMEFLSSKQVIHGDLAARNILLVDANNAKISDFGLSRKLYGYINYVKKKEEPLPWRWMAIESLRDLQFSTSSDVWMYGIFLYEVFSLGEVPYPGLSYSLEFIDNLEKGFRMLKPKYAPANLYYEVLLKCWETLPTQRPNFSYLTNYFHQALHKITAMDYTELVLGENKYFEDKQIGK